MNISNDDVDDIIINCATELEFWVKTPNEDVEINELTTSQILHEQYWNMPKGVVRKSLEEILDLMDKYDLNPEMGHKEVGGIKPSFDSKGRHRILEQLEIDWKYSDAMQACDNLLIVKSLIKEIFKRNHLEVTFLPKPIDGVAGSGQHLHLSLFLQLKNGEKINLFHSLNNSFLSSIGYGSLMGILKNYEVINPFINNFIYHPYIFIYFFLFYYLFLHFYFVLFL